MKKILVATLALVAIFTTSTVIAQGIPGTTGGSNASTMPVPPNPAAWCDANGYCGGGQVPPAVTPPTPRTPSPALPRVCVFGTIVGGRRVHTIDMTSATVEGIEMQAPRGLPASADVGFDGHCICNIAGEGSNRTGYLPADADATAMAAARDAGSGRIARDGHEICMPQIGGGSSHVNIDLGPLWIEIGRLNTVTCHEHVTNACQGLETAMDACEQQVLASGKTAESAEYHQCSASFNGTYTVPETLRGEFPECTGATFQCSADRFAVNRTPYVVPEDHVGEGNGNDNAAVHYLTNNFDLAADVNALAGSTGLPAPIVGANVGLQLNFRPFRNRERFAIVIRGTFGGGHVYDENRNGAYDVAIHGHRSATVMGGIEIGIVPRLRLDLLAGYTQYTTGNSSRVGGGDGTRGVGIRTELAAIIDLRAPRAGYGVTPYLRLGLAVERLTWDYYTDQFGSDYHNRTGVQASIGIGFRLGRTTALQTHAQSTREEATAE